MPINETKNSIAELVRRLPNDIRVLLERRIELILVELSGHLAKTASDSVYKIGGLIVVVTGLFFMLVAGALGLGELTGSMPLGFALMGTPFVLIGLLLLFRRPRTMVKRTEQKIAGSMLDAIDSSGLNRTSPQKQNLLPKDTDQKESAVVTHE